MHNSDYLREQAVKYRELAEKAEDSLEKQELRELADVCEEVANKIDDRRASG
jgi:dihydroneopterin aldolase